MSIFYSQAGEDKFLIENFLHHSKVPKFYIELGALNGVLYSNTKALEDEFGWTGILIEPNPLAFEQLMLNRPQNFLFNSLVGKDGEEVMFRYFTTPNLHAVGSIKGTQSERHNSKWMTSNPAKNSWLSDKINNDLKTVTIITQSLSSIVRKSGIPHFGLLSLDVEGHELQVLKSYDWTIHVSYILVEGSLNRSGDVVDFITSKGGKFECAVAHNMLFSFIKT